MRLIDEFTNRLTVIEGDIADLDLKILEAAHSDQPMKALIAQHNIAKGERAGIEWAIYKLEGAERDKNTVA